jgi:hypothetical protein
MATKADFTDDEWATMQKGLTGAGMLVSISDPDFTESFGEAHTLAKFLAAQREQAPTELTRELAAVHTTGFGFTGSPAKVETETLAALRSTVAILGAKAPDEVDAYRALALGIADAVAEAKSGVKAGETAAIESIKAALAPA